MKIRSVLMVALPFLLLGSVNAAEKQDAMSTLRSAEWFALGGIGVAGTTSKEEIALRAVVRDQDAAGELKALLLTANLAGQCYALLGLRLLHDPAYEKNIGRYRQNHATLKTVAGCMISEQPIASVATNMDAGRMDHALQGRVH